MRACLMCDKTQKKESQMCAAVHKDDKIITNLCDERLL